MLLCGIGLPLPEEIILVAAGYISYRGELTGDGHHPAALAFTASVAILVGDSIPYVLGRKFGPKLLRLRLVRSWISQEGLARFDSWLQRYGRLTIFVARFLPGIRVPAFFTAGSMNTPVLRFLAMDGLGVLISAPLFVWLGWYFGEDITTLVDWVRKAEQTVLILIGVGVFVAVIVYWIWHRRRTKRLLGEPVSETTVGPTQESRVIVDVEAPPATTGTAGAGQESTADTAADPEAQTADRDTASHPDEAEAVDERDPATATPPVSDESGGEPER